MKHGPIDNQHKQVFIPIKVDDSLQSETITYKISRLPG